jgi:hypothetical protein
MISVRQQDSQFIVEFSKQDVSNEFLIKLLRKYQVDQALDKNQMSEDDAWKLSEEMKEDWFKNNQSWIFEKIGVIKHEGGS